MKGRRASVETLSTRLTESLVKIIRVVVDQSIKTDPTAKDHAKTSTTKKSKRGRPKGSKNSTPKKGKRGRPKGSKNKPKVEVKGKRGRPKGSKNKPKVEVSVKVQAKGKRGRPKGSKNKPKVEAQIAAPLAVPPEIKAEAALEAAVADSGQKRRGRPMAPEKLEIIEGISCMKSDALKKQAIDLFETEIEGERVASPRKVKKLMAKIEKMDGRKAKAARRLIVDDAEKLLMGQMKSEGCSPKVLSAVFHVDKKELAAALATKTEKEKEQKKVTVASSSTPDTIEAPAPKADVPEASK